MMRGRKIESREDERKKYNRSVRKEKRMKRRRKKNYKRRGRE